MRKRRAKGRSESLIPDEAEEDESKQGEKGFYACYLLTSLCPRFKGHTYIGFTVNPRRRIRQHNGEIRSGAFRTKKRRPWEMVFCIYGFPNNVSALQFEWAWQHPIESLAVRQAAAPFKSFSGVSNKIKLAYTMLNLPAWQSLNITVNYFSTKYTTCAAACPSLPEHMKVQVCPTDELPCYTERRESLFKCSDAEDGFDEKENCASTPPTVIGAVKEKAVKLQSHFISEIPSFNRGEEGASEGQGSKTSKSDEEYNEVSYRNGTVDQINMDAIGHISLDNSHKIEKCVLYEEECSMRQPSLKNISADYNHPPSPKADHGSSLSSSFPMSETSNGDVLTLMNNTVSKVDDAENGKTLIDKGNKDKPIPQEIEVIDLLSPSPECRIMSIRKKRRVLYVCPHIIDLT